MLICTPHSQKQPRISVNEAISYWQNAIVAGGSKPVSARNRVNQLKRFRARYGDRGVGELNRFDVDAYVVKLQGLGLSNDTMRSYIKALKQFFTWCEKVGLCANLAGDVKPPKRRAVTAIKAANPAAVSGMMAAAHGRRYTARDAAIVAFMVDTGCRPCELVNLRLDMIDFSQRVAFVFGKTNTIETSRPVDFVSTTAVLLQAYLTKRPEVEHPQLFLKHYRPYEPIKYNTLRMLFQRLAKAAGVESNNTAKAIRHLVGQRFTAEKNLELARRKLGHVDIKTTMVYANVDRTAVREATENLSIVDDLLKGE